MGPGNHNGVTSFGLLLLRLSMAGMLIYGHGWAKLMAFGEKADSFPDPLGIGSTLSMASAIGAEVFAAALVALGFMTRLSAVPLVFTFIVIVFVVHGDDPFGKREMGLAYLVPFAALIFTGAGRFSLDGIFGRGA
ncbi:MAG: DoxX family protein [Myxococcales bacterium]|nr:DoxX family protein [Myxococcales bacterium]